MNWSSFSMHAPEIHITLLSFFQKATHRLPSEFLELDTLVELAVHQEKLRQPRIPLKYVAGVTRDQQGLKENCRGVVHPAVVASRDSIWHKAGNRGLHSGLLVPTYF